MKRILRIDDWFHPDGFPICLLRREPQEDFGRHAHEFTELVIVTGGGGLHETPSERWELSAGDVFVISGPREHAYPRPRDLRLVNILYQPERLDLRLLDLPALPGFHALFTPVAAGRRQVAAGAPLRLGGRDLARVLEIVDRLDAELAVREPGFGFLATAAFMQLLGELARGHDRSRSADAQAMSRIGEALSHLERHICGTVDLDEAAAIAGLSRRSFLRAFQRATGSPPLAWLIERRIGRACALLRHSGLRVTDVAFEVGFNDSNYFTRQFRKVTGETPRAYRRKSRGTGSASDLP